MSDSSEALIERVIELVCGLHTTPPQLTADTELLVTGHLDSLGIVTLVATLEQEFTIRIPDGDFTAESFSTPRSIAALLEANRAPVGPGA
jgi:acyl carrier protein